MGQALQSATAHGHSKRKAEQSVAVRFVPPSRRPIMRVEPSDEDSRELDPTGSRASTIHVELRCSPAAFHCRFHLFDGRPSVMAQQRVGLWFIGACGGVASTTALGLSAAGPRSDLDDRPGHCTASLCRTRPGRAREFHRRRSRHSPKPHCFSTAVHELHARSNGVFDERPPSQPCAPEDLERWSGEHPARRHGLPAERRDRGGFADRADVREARTPREAIDADSGRPERRSKTSHKLDHLVVVNAASYRAAVRAEGDEHRNPSNACCRPCYNRPSPAALADEQHLCLRGYGCRLPLCEHDTEPRGDTARTGRTAPASAACLTPRQDLKTGETLIKEQYSPRSSPGAQSDGVLRAGSGTTSSATATGWC